MASASGCGVGGHGAPASFRQVECAETIRYLMDAGIHFWLLTGDKKVQRSRDMPRTQQAL